jgi:hypothetical protein
MFVLDTDTLSHLMYGRQQVVDRVNQATRDVVSTVGGGASLRCNRPPGCTTDSS